jgi:hypothetical protein
VQPVKKGYHPARNSQSFVVREIEWQRELCRSVQMYLNQILHKIGMEFNTEPARREPGGSPPG